MTTDNLLDNEIPEKFKDAETGELRTDALLQSYRELEKKLSTTKAPPKSPEDYCINCDHGLFTSDADVNEKLHALGLTDDQAQAVYDLAAERLVPLVVQLASDFHADREVEKLVNHFGGPDKWREISRQLLAFGRRTMPPDVLDSLASSFEGVLALHKMMKSGEPGMQKRGQPAEGVSENDLTSMMRDPKYWRDKDPSFVAKVTEGFQKIYGN